MIASFLPQNIDGLVALGMGLDDFANGLPGGFFIYEAFGDERILYANDHMARIFACESVDEFLRYVGGTFTGLVYHEDRLRVLNSIYSQLNGENDDPMKRDHVVYRIEDKHGGLHYIEEYGSLVHGSPLGDMFFVFVSDITGASSNPRSDDERAVDAALQDGEGERRASSYFHTHTSKELQEYVIQNVERAVDEGWVTNYYQPVVRIASGRTCGMEALSRWIDPQRGKLAPAQFVPFLEEANLIHLLDRAVIARACRDVRRMSDELGYAIPVSINFAPSALTSLDVASELDRMVLKNGISRDLVHVEITESTMADDPAFLQSVIRNLHLLGYNVWMDDFGSGYSSLNLLKDYEFDVVKIDMEFLRGMEGNKKSKTIVSAITTLAHKLGMTTLVEGVETEAQLEFLRNVGADRAQGFLFSKPVPYATLVNEFFKRYPPETMHQ